MKQQIFRRVSRQSELGKYHQVRAHLLRPQRDFTHPRGIALHVTNEQIELRQRYAGHGSLFLACGPA